MSNTKWRGFERPHRLVVDEETRTPYYACFEAKPFERGFGITIANSLRRVMLSSLQGAAVTAVRIQNGKVSHDLDTLSCVYEDVIDLILNIKKIRMKMTNKKQDIATISVKKAGRITGADIKVSSNLEVVNKDLLICTLTEDKQLDIELEIKPGRGYLLASDNVDENRPAGFIPIDAHFSPIDKVNFKMENTRVGHKTDYECVRFEITTDGTIEPEEAISYGARILKDYLTIFIYFEDISVEEEEEVQEDDRLAEILDQKVDETEFTVRAYNCLQAAGISTMRDLVIKTEADMLKYKNFGRKSLNEIKTILESMGLRFGMKQEELPPPRKKKE